MLIALAFHQGDMEQAQRLISWINELGGFGQHRLLLCRESKAQQLDGLPVNIEHITFNDVYNCWPISTTLAFSTCARHIEYTNPEAFLWVEPDCVPLRPGWLDELEIEYKQTTRPFMGALVPEYRGTPAHMSGVGVWPGKMTEHAGMALMLDETTPFDLMAAETIHAQCHFSDRIFHRWDRPAKPPVKSIEEIYSVITTECVLFHGDKGGSWIDVLRKERGDAKCAAHAGETIKPDIQTGAILVKEPTRRSKGAAESSTPQPAPVSSASKPNGISVSPNEIPKNMKEVRRYAESLGKYARVNGFARMRVLKELKAVGLQSKTKNK